MNLNKVIVMGNLTKDPEMRALPSGMPTAALSIATNRFWTDKSGQKQKQTEFHNIVLFGKSAEIAKRYLTKGSSACVEGRIQTRNWQGQDGTKKYRTEIIGETLQLGPRNFNQGGNSAGATNQTGGNLNHREPQNPDPNEALDIIEYPEEDLDIGSEEIPF